MADRPVGQLVATHLYGEAQCRTPLPDRRHPVDQGVVEEDCLGVRVVQDVCQLVARIAVVHVGRDTPDLEGRVLGLGVLVPVVQVQRHLGTRTQAVRDHRRRQAGRPVVKLGPRQAPAGCRDRRTVADLVGNRFPCGGQVE